MEKKSKLLKITKEEFYEHELYKETGYINAEINKLLLRYVKKSKLPGPLKLPHVLMTFTTFIANMISVVCSDMDKMKPLPEGVETRNDLEKYFLTQFVEQITKILSFDRESRLYNALNSP